jgi:hypothetical protein
MTSVPCSIPHSAIMTLVTGFTADHDASYTPTS